MSDRNPLVTGVLVLTLLVVGSLLVGFGLGQPVLLSYVETGSMEPTIEAGDGFVAIPSAITGPPEAGDVIVFEAEEIDGGGLTTHRVVAVTEHGYVTQGDANVVTDQDGAEPHVTDGQVVAVAWQPGGEVLTIPHLGTAVMGVQSGVESFQRSAAGALGTTALLGDTGITYLLLGFGTVVILLSFALDRGSRRRRRRSTLRRRRDSFDARTLVIGMASLIALVTILTMVAMSGSVEFGVVSAEQDSGAPHVLLAGETEDQVFEQRNEGILPYVAIAEPASDGVDLDEEPIRLGRNESANMTVEVSAPSETGYYLRSFEEYRYFAVLPTPVIANLHAVHPWAAMGAATAVVVALVALPFATLVGTGTIRTRERRRSGHRSGILRRLRKR